MAEIWPGTLSNHILIDGYSETAPNNMIRSKMDEGPPKTRRLSIAARRPITAQKHMYTSELELFDTFYTETLVEGTLSFDWVHPRDNSTAVEMMFTAPPVYSSLGGTAWNVTMNLEILP